MNLTTFIEEKEKELEEKVKGKIIFPDESTDFETIENLKSFLRQALTEAMRYKEREIREKVEDITVIGIGAIPETNEYAKGWNDCRQEYFSRRFKPFREKVLTLLTALEDKNKDHDNV